MVYGKVLLEPSYEDNTQIHYGASHIKESRLMMELERSNKLSNELQRCIDLLNDKLTPIKVDKPVSDDREPIICSGSPVAKALELHNNMLQDAIMKINCMVNEVDL